MNEQSFEYRTGQTQPEKSSQGLIAFLLICVIFLCGVVSVLGMMNVKLLNMLQNKEETPLSFAEASTAATEVGETSLTLGGITLQEIPVTYQQFQGLPAGLYVVEAPEGSSIAPGDVLTNFDRTAVTTLAELTALQSNCQAGQQVELIFYRQDGAYFTHTIPFGK